MEFRVLGPLEVREGDRSFPLGSPKQRALLALLLLKANRVVSRELLIDQLWGDRPPRTAVANLQVYVSRLRKLLPEATLLTRPQGYLLEVEQESLDLWRFERLLTDARKARPERASRLLGEALALWRGPPLAEFAGEPFAQTEAGRLEEMRLAALEDRIEADLVLGQDAELIAELEALVAEQPYRERLRGQLILALYRCGRQADALAAYQDARRELVDMLGIEPGTELKQLERRILAQDATLLAPPRTLDHTNLPVPPTAFLGREHELSELTGLLRGGVRLVTLTGPGGSGKTRLALQAAAAVSEQFPDGVWWVPLASLRDPALVLGEVARVLATDQSGRELAEALGEVLAGKRLLLLLDNAEHLLPGAAAAVALLRDADGPKLLVTSRERLRLAGEQIYPVAPLTKPDGLALFTARAREVSPGFEADASVEELCDRLDNLPLALELAAANVTVLTPAQIVQRLNKRLSLLTRGPRDVPEHQRTLRATIDWSYQLLSEEDGRLFRRLAVFTGGCGLEAAEAVACADLDTLATLVDKSLLNPIGDDRFLMLETLREFALEQLEDAGERDEFALRHARYYLEQLEKIAPERLGPRTAEFLAWFRTEADNLRTMLDRLTDVSPPEAARAAYLLSPYWEAHGWLTEGCKHLGVLLAEDLPAALRAGLLQRLSGLEIRLGQLEEAEKTSRSAIEFAEVAGEGLVLTHALRDLAWIEHNRGRHDEAIALGKRAVSEAKVARNRRAEMLSLAELGTFLAGAGRNSEARAALTQAISGVRRLGDGSNEAILTADLAELDFFDGEYEMAHKGFTDAAAALAASGHVTSRATMLNGAAYCVLALDQHAAAAETWLDVISIAVETGETAEIANSIGGIALAAASVDASAAARLRGAAMELRAAHGLQLDSRTSEIERRFEEPLVAALGADGFAREQRASAALRLEDAIVLAQSLAARLSTPESTTPH